ncbi:peptidylprolyl isomerase [Candidatus Woesearchaeota archaeon]|nr:peptidylprolyl isomerase [Candidatus Woesearchaeota archaeon]MBW3016743.1 peptidylprolyl isomerase [Candidatus Woesearchaeota archaeon]
MAEKKAQKGSKVKIEYTGKLDDGTVFDTTEGRNAFEFEIGAGQVLPDFEKQVIGMKAGDTKKIKLSAEQAYGAVNEKLVKEIPRELLNTNNVEPKPGMKLKVEPRDNPGMARVATITKVDDKTVTIDLNHPLAGKALNFEIKLVELLN